MPLDLSGGKSKMRSFVEQEFKIHKDAHCTSGNRYYYEEMFEFKNDPILKQAGVKIGARVYFKYPVAKKSQTALVFFAGRFDPIVEVDYSKMAPQNRIVFKKGSIEKEVACVHTAITTVTVDQLAGMTEEQIDRNMVEFARTTEGNKPIILEPREHFIALKIFVAGIVELGLENIILMTYHSEEDNPETLPFGFNSALQSQIAQCLTKVCPKEAYHILSNLVEELWESVPKEWLKPRINMIEKMYGLDLLRLKFYEQGDTKEYWYDRFPANFRSKMIFLEERGFKSHLDALEILFGSGKIQNRYLIELRVKVLEWVVNRNSVIVPLDKREINKIKEWGKKKNE
jgi:hypothetical protein